MRNNTFSHSDIYYNGSSNNAMKNVLVLTMPNTRQYTIDTSGNNTVGTVFSFKNQFVLSFFRVYLHNIHIHMLTLSCYGSTSTNSHVRTVADEWLYCSISWCSAAVQTGDEEHLELGLLRNSGYEVFQHELLQKRVFQRWKASVMSQNVGVALVNPQDN